MKRYAPLLALLLLTACVGVAGTRQPHSVGATSSLVDRFWMLTGTAGTATVGAGKYATLCTAAGTATNATVVVTPCGPSIPTCTAAYTVTVPSGVPVSIPFGASPDQAADGTTVVFSNTTAYFCSGTQYNP